MNLELFHSPELVVFTTRDFARAANVSVTAASHQLSRRRRSSRSFRQLTRGVWANVSHPQFGPLLCVPALLGAEQGYVSFLTALHLHGAISQIPASIQVATTGHPRKLQTDVALFEFFQLKPELHLAGVEWSTTFPPYRIATVEKALLDTFYIATRKKRRFAKLPELHLRDAKFSARQFRNLLKLAKLPQPIASAVDKLWRTSAHI